MSTAPRWMASAAVWALLTVGASACAPHAAGTKAPKSPGEAELDWPEAFDRREGLFPLHVDVTAGRLWIELPPVDETGHSASCLYLVGLRQGLGSSALGFDRGSFQNAKLVHWRRLGSKVVLEEENLAFRAQGAPKEEGEAVRDSFPGSVLWAGELVKELEDGNLLVDITSLATGDPVQLGTGLSPQGEDKGHGRVSLDPERSAFDPASVLAFPDNLAFEGQVAYSVQEASYTLARNLPDASSLSVRVHHSFVRLPDSGYRARKWHPASGAMADGFLDFAAPLNEEIQRRYILRHRLEEGEKLVYYVDPGAPEPIRAALIEGASWWEDAFAAAGFPDAFEVRVLPEDAHPMDVRYNVISWVHRQSRGWSYGHPIADPRTGEIIKGNVTLGSQRIRQDILIFEALSGAAKTGSGDADDPEQLALARIRQLAAHEVGHTLGIAHNFAASSYGRASVMDYPPPRIRLKGAGNDARLDLSEAYAVGIGDWDRQVVRYMYTDFGAESEEAGLRAILDESREKGWLYIPDGDGRAVGTAHPKASVWDDGADSVDGLNEALAVRRYALDRFGTQTLREGMDRSELERRLVLVYFHHRYQLDAAMKWIGGMDYDYDRALAEPAVRLITAADQRRALEAVLRVLSAEELALGRTIWEQLPPRPEGESFARQTQPSFDSLGAAASATRQVLRGLLDAQRLARLVEHRHRDPNQPGLEAVLEQLVAHSFDPVVAKMPAELGEIQRVIQASVVDELISAAQNPALPHRVHARLEGALAELRATLSKRAKGMRGADLAHTLDLVAELKRYFDRPAGPAKAPAPAAPPPPGSPIGAGELGASTCTWAESP